VRLTTLGHARPYPTLRPHLALIIPRVDHSASPASEILLPAGSSTARPSQHALYGKPAETSFQTLATELQRSTCHETRPGRLDPTCATSHLVLSAAQSATVVADDVPPSAPRTTQSSHPPSKRLILRSLKLASTVRYTPPSQSLLASLRAGAPIAVPPAALVIPALLQAVTPARARAPAPARTSPPTTAPPLTRARAPPFALAGAVAPGRAARVGPRAGPGSANRARGGT